MEKKTILCYGDSNTWGYIPQANVNTLSIARYDYHERWPGALQQLLGKQYYVIEEGLNGRTTNLNYAIPPDRNGKTYLPPCLYSQAPLDLVILALGANDFKVYFNREPKAIRDGLAELIDIIKTSSYGPKLSTAPKVLILNAPIVLPLAETHRDEQGVQVFAGAIKKAEDLVTLYAELAKTKDCYYLDTSKHILPSSIDGGHFDLKAHQQLAKMVAEQIQTIF